MTTAFFVATVFLAVAVEAIEALTIVLAIGITRGWRSVWLATIVGLATVAGAAVVFGVALSVVPLYIIWIVGGSLLLIFGLQWTNKAILRYAGLKPERDELEVYDKKKREASKNRKARGVIDWYSFIVVYKSIILEGLEIIFIVIAFGTAINNMQLGVMVSLAAIFTVALSGFFIHKPLAKIPENTMKFVVGIVLASFGTIFTCLGVGAPIPQEHAAFAFLCALYIGVSMLTIQLLIDKNTVHINKVMRNMWIGLISCVVLGLALLVIFTNNPLPADVTYSTIRMIS